MFTYFIIVFRKVAFIAIIVAACVDVTLFKLIAVYVSPMPCMVTCLNVTQTASVFSVLSLNVLSVGCHFVLGENIINAK